MPTLDELAQKLLSAYGIRWVDKQDLAKPSLQSGYFERTLNGKTFGCPVSVNRGVCLNPRLIRLIYRRLDIADDPFEFN